MLINQQASPKSKQQLTIDLGVSRSSLYYQPKLPAKDLMLKQEVEAVLKDHPAYGHRRIAWHLGMNPKRVRRVMRLFGLKPRRKARLRLPHKPEDIGQEPMTIPNLLLGTLINAPSIAWQSDFTYLPYFGKFIYLATVIDACTREILGWTLGTRHTTELISQAFLSALDKHPKPHIFHSDQGSEYRSHEFINLLKTHTITPSMSAKSSPWQNGKQESFYGKFKLELGHPECYPTMGELIEAIARQIHYYNHDRIHTALRCSPTLFKQRYFINQLIPVKAEGVSV
jgi:putative transposase